MLSNRTVDMILYVEFGKCSRTGTAGQNNIFHRPGEISRSMNDHVLHRRRVGDQGEVLTGRDGCMTLEKVRE